MKYEEIDTKKLKAQIMISPKEILTSLDFEDLEYIKGTMFALSSHIETEIREFIERRKLEKRKSHLKVVK